MHNIVIGLLFGDEAKGATTDYLCSVEPVDFVVRFSGGPQTAHNVILEDGTHHTFSQFGSGTFRGAKTLLSRFALVNPLNLINEANALEEVLGFDPLSLLFVSENSLMITPLHRRANQTRERQRGAGAHGSCGQGIGESMDYSIRYPDYAPRIGDLRDLPALRRKLRLYKAWVEINLGVDLEDDVDEIIESYTAMMNERTINIITDYQVIQYIKNAKNLVFEGTQGTLLDENFGFHPHTTWSTTTVKNARWLLEAADIPRSQYRVIGAMRTYMTRHGHGPFLSEFPSDYDWSEKFPEPHNKRGVFQGAWRVGHLDLNFLSYAADANDEQIDAIALSHCDVALDEIEYTDVRLDAPRGAGHDAQQRMTDAIFAARAKREEGESYKTLPITELEDLEKEIEFATGAKVLIRSYGPTAANRTWMDPEQPVF